jgi:CRP-like cAMP-binding protein
VRLDADVARLAKTRPFNLMPREAVQLIAFSCPKQRLVAGEILFSAGDAGEEGYFIVSGAMIIEDRRSTTGSARRAASGALIGESALYAPVVRRVEARATEDTIVTRIPRDTFKRVLAEFPEAAEKVRAALAVRTRALVESLDKTRVRSLDGGVRRTRVPT